MLLLCLLARNMKAGVSYPSLDLASDPIIYNASSRLQEAAKELPGALL